MKRFFESFFEPRLKDQYLVVYQGQVIAKLSEPDIPDQFWVSFLLRPETTDEKLLQILYNENTWDKDIIIKEESGRLVQFLLQIESELEKRPERIMLRGPYKI